jgi:L-ascorbate metabolism protein UlaG (beta-lactamase superfamily)
LKKTLSRRRFLQLSAVGAAGTAAWVSTSQQWTPKFIRERFSEIGLDVQQARHKPAPNKWSDQNITASWLGHSTVLINFYGLTILTDPVLFRRVGADLGFGTLGPKRRVAAALGSKEVPPVDLALLSHAHLDHFDMPSLKTLRPETKVVTAHRTADLLSGTKVAKNAKELSWGQKTVVKTGHGEIEVEAFQVKHWGARWRHDTYRGYNGYILSRGGKKVIFGGDTALCTGFSEIKNKGPFELACMPIGAYNPWIYSHCNPEQAVRMANEAGAKHILPIHHYTFRFGRECCTEPIERLQEALKQEPERLALKEAGETFLVA